MTSFNVKGMSCCCSAKLIAQAVRNIDADARVLVDLTHRRVEIDSVKSATELAAAIDELDYLVVLEESKNCNLTGMCYDDDMLKPIYDFLELRNFDTTNFEDLLNSCFDAMRKTLKDEEEYMYTDEYISEEIISNDYEFTENGNIF